MVRTVAYTVGYLLIVLTAITAAHGAWRRRETHRLDILALVSLLVFAQFREGLGLGRMGIGVVLAEPYVLLRLVRHFRRVPAALPYIALGVVGLGSLLFGVLPRPSPPAFQSAVVLYVVSVSAYAALAFTREVRRSSGVTARRLLFASCGTWCFAAVFVPSLISPWLGLQYGRVGGQVSNWMTTGMLASYYLAFNTPRWLRSAWQRAEQAKYLSLAADLDPQERGERTAEDLRRAAAGAAGNSFVLVAVRASPAAAELVVQAASNRALVGLTFTPGNGAVGDAFRSGAAASARPDECEPDIAGLLRPVAARVLVAPIATTVHHWGVVIVAQRLGSLFPEDDLRLLAQLGRYAGTALDHAQLVTEARERERKAADRRLREAESRMGLMLDNIRDYAMFVLDDRGRVVVWHIGAQHVFGYAATEMTDEPAAPLYGMSDAEFLALLAEARQLGRADREGPCRRRDGGRFLGATIIRPLEGDDGDLQGFVGVTRDVTEQRDLEQRLRQSQKMDAIGRLAGGIAHDFNNLLTAILGYADWLAQDFGADPVRLQQVQEIQKAGERAAALTRQLLAFSRQQVLQPVPINLSRLTADLLPMLRRVIGEHIEVVDLTSPGISAVLGDRSQLEQVIVNLAVNARDAMPTGGQLTIRTASGWLDQSTAGDALPGPYAMLEVGDTGVGMDAATQARVFEPFFTTKEFGRGTGLGLATVYGIVKQMGGTVRIESVPEEGTTFRLYFPETRRREPTPLQPAARDVSRGSETLLLVEDDPAVRWFLTQVLERQGYRVLSAEHQAAAIAIAQAHLEPIHLLITDVVMPGGTGPELVAALYELRPGTPTLFISGYADAVLSRQGMFPKASHFLQKPFSAADLLTRIREILSRG